MEDNTQNKEQIKPQETTNRNTDTHHQEEQELKKVLDIEVLEL